MKGSKSYKVLIRTIPDLFEAAKPKYVFMLDMASLRCTHFVYNFWDDSLLPNSTPEWQKKYVNKELIQNSRWNPLYNKDNEQIGWRCEVYRYKESFKAKYGCPQRWHKFHYASFVLDYLFPKAENS